MQVVGDEEILQRNLDVPVQAGPARNQMGLAGRGNDHAGIVRIDRIATAGSIEGGIAALAKVGARQVLDVDHRELALAIEVDRADTDSEGRRSATMADAGPTIGLFEARQRELTAVGMADRLHHIQGACYRLDASSISESSWATRVSPTISALVMRMVVVTSRVKP